MDIELRNIHKFYGSVHANRGIDLRVQGGTIHGILGENGAGKSTLMKILAGAVPASDGQILLDGRPVTFSNPAEASRLGIGMLYQDPLDFPPLTVLENFMVGRPARPKRGVRYWADTLKGMCRDFGFSLDPKAPLETLTLGERQQLELLRLLSVGSRLLILDEPTTGISPEQKELLFRALRRLAHEGKTVLLVSHKLEDVENLCSRVTVLRHGAVTGSLEAPFNAQDMLALMFGTPPAPLEKRRRTFSEKTLELRRVSGLGGRAGLRDATAAFHRGEVVGLAGLEGSGQGVFLRLAAGLQPPLEGSIHLFGKDLTGWDYHAFRRRGVAFVPEGRLEEGLIAGLTLTDHFALAACAPKLCVPWVTARRTAEERVERFRIRGRPESAADALSGGNQQRLLLSLIPPEASVLLLEQPTRGLDVESTYWVWEHLLRLADDGATIVFSSAELDEILMTADRVLVFYNGRIVLDVDAESAHPDLLGSAIAGRVIS
ncbi:MAG: ATP-binding cassette domain-containing protein [Desulfosoma sp.]